MIEPEPIETTAEQFCSWQRDYNGVSETRVREVGRMLADLGESIDGQPEAATGRDFERWLKGLASLGQHPNTVRKKGNMVRPFFSWAYREGLINADQLLTLREVPNPRGATGESKPKPYRRKEIAQLWMEVHRDYPRADRFIKRYADGKSRYPRIAVHGAGLQIAAVIHLCLHAGLRREEVFRLTVDDLHPDNAYIVVTGAAKGMGGKEPRMREVPMTVDLRKALIEWLDFRAVLNPGHDRPWLVLNARASRNGVIPSHPFDPMSWDRFTRLLTHMGSGWEMHRLRHTFATEMLRAGMPLENLKELLGHARLQQTLAYAKIVPQDNERHVRRVEATFTRALAREVA